MSKNSVSLESVGDGLNVIWNGSPLYSRYQPRHGAERGLPTAEDRVLYFVPSPLLGYGLDKFLEKLPASSHVFCVEFDSDLIAITEKHLANWQTLQVDFLAAPNEKNTDTLLKKLNMDRFDRCICFHVNGGHLLSSDLYQAIYRFCCHALQTHHQNREVLQKNGDLWLSHFIKNLALLPQTQSYNLEPSHDPILVVGAGASLEKILNDIKRYRRSFRLVAVDTAVPCLLAHDIVPDLVFILESSYHNLQDFISFPRDNLVIIRDLTSFPQQARLFSCYQALFLTHFAPLSLLKRLQNAIPLLTLPPLGSVGVAALGFALKITKGPIFFTGLDFSFHLGKNHARGAYSHQLSLQNWHRLAPNPMLSQQLTRPLIPQENGYGEKIYTDPILLNYAQMAGQGSKEQIFCLSQDGLSLGYQQKSLSGLLPCKNSWSFFNAARLCSRPLHQFVQNELAFLDQYFEKDYTVKSNIDYIFLGYPKGSEEELWLSPPITKRVAVLYKLWQECLSSLPNMRTPD